MAINNKPSKDETARNKKKTEMKVLICVLCVVLVSLIGVILYFVFRTPRRKNVGSSKLSSWSNNSTESTTEDVTETDADTYFKENSEVLSVIKADESKEALSEKEAKKSFAERGFEEGEITSSFSITGEYKETTISDSSEKHPYYDMYYVNSNDEVWNVSIINNSIMAYPSSYNLQSDLGVEVIVSETKEVMSYDCESNTFYKNIPKETVLLVIQKDRIESTLLDELTKEEIDKLVK